jgi:hypothetical protein
MKRTLALDPGGTTGWVLAEDGTVRQHGQLGPEEHHLELWALFCKYHQGDSDTPPADDFTIVSESFQFRQNDGERWGIRLDSKEYEGVIKLYARFTNVPVVFQTAGEAKGFITDEKLKVMGLWLPGEKHARDAMRHLLNFQIKREKRRDLLESWRKL